MLVRTIGVLGIALGLGVASCGSDEEEGGSAGSGGSAGTSSGTGGKGAAGNAGRAGASGSGGRSGGAGGDGSGGQSEDGGGAGGDSGGEGGVAGAGRGGDAGQGGENAAGGAGRADQSGGAAGGAGEGGAAAGNAGDPGAGGEAGSGDPVLPITVFDGGTRNGGIEYSGRVGLDAVCATAKEALVLSGGSPRALISVGPSDQIADFPSLYGLPTDRPFAGPGGAVIAGNFADLLDGSIDLSLEDAGVITSEPGFWFTGSESDGTASPNDCAGWTFSQLDQTIRANYGQTYSSDTRWLGVDATATCGAGQYHIVCLTW